MRRRIVIFGWAESVHIQRWARGIQSRGYDVRVVSLGGEPLGDVDTVVLPRFGALSYLSKSGQAAKAALEFQPDLVHVHYAGGFGAWGLRTKHHPLVVSVWGADLIGISESGWRKRWLRHLLPKSDLVTATSERLKRDCLQLGVIGDERVEVIPFGVELNPTPTEYRELPKRLCFIKSLRPKYGADVLLRSLAMVKAVHSGLRLTIAGDGPSRDELEALATELGLDHDVTFLGRIPNKDVYDLLGDHDIMVMPSVEDSESFGVAALEASACGRPVIASRVGGVPEVVRDGETGLLVPPKNVDALADAILRLSTDSELCRQLGTAGRKLVESEYSWDKSLDLMCGVYDRLIHDR